MIIAIECVEKCICHPKLQNRNIGGTMEHEENKENKQKHSYEDI